MLKKWFVILILCCTAHWSYAQFDYSMKDVPVSERLRFGGFFNMQFGTYTAIEISPSVGFLVTPRYMTGLGASFIYSKYTAGPVSYDPNIWYAVRNFHRYFFTPNLFAWGEIEWLNYEYQNPFYPYNLDRIWFTTYFAGGGYMTRFSNGRGGMYVSVLFNLNHGPSSPYGSQFTPIPRFGVFF